jgi:DnaK suppressor protein
MDRKNPLTRLTSRLIAQRDALRKALDADLDDFGDVADSSGVGDHVDAAVDGANEEISSQLVEIESRVLGQIDHALHRIATGAYGRCEFCGRRIAASRLNALPYANSCIDCQREHEKCRRPAAPQPDWQCWEKVSERSIDEGQNDSPIDPGYQDLTLGDLARCSTSSLFV